MILVSACLAGFNTRYNGSNSLKEKVLKLVKEGKAIPVCPEQQGGLPIPRPAVEFTEGDGKDALEGKARTVSAGGEDFTPALLKGARETLRIAELYKAKEAILKDGSPSCGCTYVHSGGKKIPGRGITAELLSSKGLKILSDDTL